MASGVPPLPICPHWAMALARPSATTRFPSQVQAKGRSPSPRPIRLVSVMIPPMLPEDGITDEELDAVERRADAATAGPWKSYVEGRNNQSGDSFIGTGDPDQSDLYISYLWWPEDQRRANEQRHENDLDFIAAARQDVPRLVAEVRRLKKRLSEPQ